MPPYFQYQRLSEALNGTRIWVCTSKQTLLTNIWLKSKLILSSLLVLKSYLYLGHLMELRKSIVLKITAMNYILWKHIFFWDLSRTVARTQNRRNRLCTIYSETSCIRKKEMWKGVFRSCPVWSCDNIILSRSRSRSNHDHAGYGHSRKTQLLFS